GAGGWGDGGRGPGRGEAGRRGTRGWAAGRGRQARAADGARRARPGRHRGPRRRCQDRPHQGWPQHPDELAVRRGELTRRWPHLATAWFILGGERTANHADLTPPNRLMASVRRIPALSTVASAHVQWGAVWKTWHFPRSPQARGMRSVPPSKEDGC